MTRPEPQIRFSITQDGSDWCWRAVRDAQVVAEGRAPTRAVAAAFIIRTICEVCGAAYGAAAEVLAEAA